MEFVIRQTVYLARENNVLHYAQPLEYGDACAHRWMVTINKDGAEVDLGAMSAKCYVTRAASDAERAQGVTSVTLIQDAEIDAQTGTVSCVFDAACYGGVGAFAAIMRVSDADGATVTAAKMTACLKRSTSDAVYDPDGLVLSLDALLAQIEAMEAATAAAKTATKSANTATGKANTATTNANNAANNASKQAEAAKSAAAAANAAAKSWGDSTAANSEKLGGKAPEYYLQPMNLLDNSDFTNPVNQRGITSETDILRYAYFIDRWRNSSDITTKYGLSNQGVTISGDAGISQYIEWIESGTVLTAAVKYGGKIICVTGTIEYNGTSYKTIAHYGDGTANVFLVTKDGNAGIMISKDTSVSSITVEWAALYEGSYTADTLPPYVPKGYAAEMMECQRYYHLYATSAARPSNGLDCCPPMRISGVTQGTTTVDGETRYYNSADL